MEQKLKSAGPARSKWPTEEQFPRMACGCAAFVSSVEKSWKLGPYTEDAKGENLLCLSPNHNKLLPNMQRCLFNDLFVIHASNHAQLHKQVHQGSLLRDGHDRCPLLNT